MTRAVLCLVVAAAGCAADIDPEWQLDHERIIAVRATPPHVPAGATSQLDLLVGHKGAPTETKPPDAATVVSPPSLASALSGTTITAPGEDQLAAARAQLGLVAGDAVPLRIGVLSGNLAAVTTVWLGDAGDNPSLASVTFGGAVPPYELVVPPDTDVRLFVDADDAVETVNWLTSCGTMHDFDLHSAYIHVLPADPQSGELAIVRRDGRGGVAWQVWPIHVE